MTIIGQKNVNQGNIAKETAEPRRIPSLALIAASMFTLTAAALPLLYLIRRALQIESGLLRTVLLRAKTFEIIVTTISLALSVVALATLIGVSIAWALSNVD
jgi:ABC-type Fe3+ transport system permease subunit